MEVIRFKGTGGAVSFRVRVTGPVVWRYRYDADRAVFSRKSNEGPPPPHVLGTPEELQGDVNSWDVHVVSPDQKGNYEIAITWSQDDQEIHAWKRQGSVTGDRPETARGDAFLLVAK